MMGKVFLFVTDMAFIKSTMLSKTNSFPKMETGDLGLTVMPLACSTTLSLVLFR